jgi:tetratricopeptide (TPR) repeat protein
MLKSISAAILSAALVTVAAPTFSHAQSPTPEVRFACCHKPADVSEERAQRLHSADRLLEIGEECEAHGDIDMARNCFEEVLQLCPGSARAAAASGHISALAQAANKPTSAEQLGAETVDPPASDVPTSTPDSHKFAEAKRMYHLGERYHENGDLVNARLCFLESWLICPSTSIGYLGLDKFNELDKAMAQVHGEDAVEEQEIPAVAPAGLSDCAWHNREQARHLYSLGEHCRASGDLPMALDYYHEAYELSPDTYYGQRSWQRMTKWGGM